MQIHNVKKLHPNHREKRVGRGGKRGTFSGKGTKGQKARAGRKMRPELRDIIKKLPKLRGRGKNIFQSIQLDAIPVNLDLLEKNFKDGETVSSKTLVEKRLIRKNQSGLPIKILGRGTLSRKLTVSGCVLSHSAKAAIEKNGGTVS